MTITGRYNCNNEFEIGTVAVVVLDMVFDSTVRIMFWMCLKANSIVLDHVSNHKDTCHQQ